MEKPTDTTNTATAQALTTPSGSVRRYINLARERGIDEEDYGDAEYFTRLALKELDKVDEQIKALETELSKTKAQPDSLSQALNEGDGVYRP